MKSNTLISTSLILLALSMNSPHSQAEDFDQHKNHTQVKQHITDMINAVDNKNWKAATDKFADDVFVDYSSLSGQPGSQVKATDLVGSWEGLLTKVSTHHMLSNFDITIDKDSAEVFSHVYASHQAKEAGYWDAYGRYHHKLNKTPEGWEITSMKLIMHGQKGNLNFLQEIQQ